MAKGGSCHSQAPPGKKGKKMEAKKSVPIFLPPFFASATNGNLANSKRPDTLNFGGKKIRSRISLSLYFCLAFIFLPVIFCLTFPWESQI